MFEFQPDRVHPELVARSKEMLLDIDVAKVQAVGPAAITFYVWVRIHLHALSVSELLFSPSSFTFYNTAKIYIH